MELRSLVKLAGEAVAIYYPMTTFIHHNPLHGLEHLSFDEAISKGQVLFGGRGYLKPATYRTYAQLGLITPTQIDRTLAPLATGEPVHLGPCVISHLDVLRAQLLHGFLVPAEDQLKAWLEGAPDDPTLTALSERLRTACHPRDPTRHMYATVHGDHAMLGREITLSAWCDRLLNSGIQDQINGRLIKWCAAFLDQGQATWTMPHRQETLYGAWKKLARTDLSEARRGPLAWREFMDTLPPSPEDAVLDSLTMLEIPKMLWEEYLTLHLTALPGWTGLINWRSRQPDSEWQRAYPVDLVSYLALRLTYERDLVTRTCRGELGLAGIYPVLADYMITRPEAYFLRKAHASGDLPEHIACQVDHLIIQGPGRAGHAESFKRLTDEYVREQAEDLPRLSSFGAAWRLRELAKAINLPPRTVESAGSDHLTRLLSWMDGFPEHQHGPRWIEILEAAYRDALVPQLTRRARRPDVAGSEPGSASVVRPTVQAVFCIDVRSECLRRHLEQIGGHETFGIAGFFGLPIRYRPFGRDHHADLCPALVKPRYVIREVPRAYHGQEAQQHLAMAELTQTGHALLHDLKENVITPYVMVEAVGWFYALPLLGKTLLPGAYRAISVWIKRRLSAKVATTMTIDKLTRSVAYEMVAVEQRAAIRLALQRRLGRYAARTSHELVEAIRKRALEEPGSQNATRLVDLSATDQSMLIEDLRRHYGIDSRSAIEQLDRITRTGLAEVEQVYHVETALRLMGLTRTFARLVLFCAHGSSSENNPYESALDCGACGGHPGAANARALAAMANKTSVRTHLGKRGISIPPDTYFCAGEHDTATDAVRLFDLEDIPPTHRTDLLQLVRDLEVAAAHTSEERAGRFPDAPSGSSLSGFQRHTARRSVDWAQVRPEWGLSRNAAIIIGGRHLTRGLNLGSRAFLHSYDAAQDPSGMLLETILTGPLIVAQWINMEHYFSTTDNEVYGSGSKAYHNVVGRSGVMYGTSSDLRIGLPQQTVMSGEMPYHDPLRLLAVVEAQPARINTVIERNPILRRLLNGRWIHLVAIDPTLGTAQQYTPPGAWHSLTLDAASTH